MNRILSIVDNVIERIEIFISTICFTLMTIITLFGVFFRFVLNNPLIWAEESARYLMIWGIFIGISIATRKNSHLGIDIIAANSPPKVRKALTYGSSILLIITFIVMFVLSAMYVQTALRTGQTSPILNIPYWLIYLALPIGFGLSALRAVQVLVDLMTGKDIHAEEVMI